MLPSSQVVMTYYRKSHLFRNLNLNIGNGDKKTINSDVYQAKKANAVPD